MNPSMYLVAVLALCALPSALGLTCYKCTSNVTALELCDNMTTYHTETCQGAGAHCARTEVITSVSASTKAYILGCVDEPHNCTSYQTSLCANVTAEATAGGATVTKCVSTCCNDTNKCIPAPTSMPPTTATGTGTGTGTSSTAMSTTAAAVTFRPELIGLLLTVLSAVYFGVQ